MNDFLYGELNKAWKTTSRILFKDEIGELKEYEGWLSEYIINPVERGEVKVTSSDYPKNARYVSYKSIDFMKRFEPLNINEIKDIDSIVEALKERFIYAGNIVLGKSQFVEKSNNVIDSHYILNSNFITKGKYIAHSSYLQKSQYIFGCHDADNTNFAIRSICFGGAEQSQRLFEIMSVETSADVYYSSNISGSHEIMFSFFLYGKSYYIGNIQLERSKYFSIKEAFLEQLRELLKKGKAPKFSDMIIEKEKEEKIEVVEEKEFNIEPVEKAFNTTSKIILGKELEGLEEFSEWLKKDNNFLNMSKSVSPLSGKEVYTLDEYYPSMRGKEEYYIIYEEKKIISERKADKRIIEDFDLMKAGEYVKNISYLSLYFKRRSNNVYPPILNLESRDNYFSPISVNSKLTSFSFWPLVSSYLFGTSFMSDSSFAIKGHYSSNVQRGFEIDMVNYSSDVYFSHNVENIIEGMFCFNVKGINYAIGNAKYDPETYRRIKSSLLEQIGEELERKKDLKWSIYNIGVEFN